MADRLTDNSVSELQASRLNDRDLIGIVDISDPTDHVTGTLKKITYKTLKDSISGNQNYNQNPVLLDDYQSHTNYTLGVSGGSGSTVAANAAGGRVQIASASANTTTMTCTRTTALSYPGNGLGVIAAAFNVSGMNSGLGLRLGASEFVSRNDSASTPFYRRGIKWHSWNVSEFPTFFADTTPSTRQVQLYCQLVGNTGVTTVGFGPVYYNAAGKTYIILGFDDLHVNQYNYAFQSMKSRGLVGNIYVPSTYVGGTNRMTFANLVEMKANGWAMCVDSTPDDSLTIFTNQVTSVDALNVGRQYLLSSGLAADGSELHGCWTNGLWNTNGGPPSDATAAAFSAAGMRSMRTTQNDTSYERFGIGDQAMTMPSGSGGISGVGSGGAATLLAQVDLAISRGASQAFHFHDILASGASGTQQNAQAFDDFCAGLAARVTAGSIEVVTRPQWWRIVSQNRPLSIPT